MLEELRISSLGVIDESVLELGPGFTAITGETGAGKTMVVTALGLLLGGRADSGAVRTGARSARVEGLVRVDVDGLAAAVDEVGGEVEDGRAGAGPPDLGRGSLAGLRRRRVGARVDAGHPGRPAGRGARPVRPAPAAPSRRPARRARQLRRRQGASGCASGSAQGYAALRATEAELADVVESARERAREADLLRFGLGEVEAVDPQPGEDAALAAEESRLGFADTLRTAAEQARECLSAEDGGPDALGAVSAARKLLDGVREHDAEAAGLADRLAEVSYLLSDVAADVASYASTLETDPARLAAVSERRAALVALTRKYGDTIDDVLAWSEQAVGPAARARRHRRADRRADRPARPTPRGAGRRRGGPDRGPDQGGRPGSGPW